jgi:hypothetical protein
MKTSIVLEERLPSMVRATIAPGCVHMGIQRRGLFTYFASFVSPTNADYQTLPDSAEEWLASREAIEIGSTGAPSKPAPTIHL